MRYLLDTNIISDLMRDPQGRVAERIRKVGQAQVCTSIVVAAELRYGVTKRGSPRLSAQLEAILSVLEIVALDVPADRTYGALRAQLERRGQLIGANDLLIASQAVALGYTLVTDNEKEFARIPQLHQQNWLRPGKATAER